MTLNDELYDELFEAAKSKATGSKVASIIVRAYGWQLLLANNGVVDRSADRATT